MEALNEVTFDRVYEASLEQVWKAWTTPEMVKQWWGPNDVSIPDCEMDVRVGGRFYIVMEAGEGMGPFKGTRWPMEAAFTAVEENAKLAWSGKAWTEGKEGETDIEQNTEVTLTEEGGKTKLHVKAAITKAGPAAGMAVQGMKYGFDQQLNKLATFLG